MDATVELQYERLNSLQQSDLEPLPNATKLISRIRGLEQTIYEILPALSVVLSQTETNDLAAQHMRKVSELANQLGILLDDLESEAAHLARDSLTGCFTSTTCFTCGRRLQKRLAVITSGFNKLAPYFDGFKQHNTILYRDEDLKEIVNRLLSNDENANIPVAVHCIVGSPGIGKTALARLAYNDEQLTSRFNVTAWVVVSKTFDSHRVSQDLLQELVAKKQLGGTQDLLQKLGIGRQLGAYLKKKRFLFVLDHVCEIDESIWGNFMASLTSAAPGSRLLMTMTTDAYDKLPQEAKKMQKYELDRLTEEDSLSLFKKMAFPDGTPAEDEEVSAAQERKVLMAKDMLDECKGNPGVINLLGEILKDKKTEAEWDTTLSRSINFDLIIAYNMFTATLKRCFAYCSILPKDYKVSRETLIQLWIAQDFVTQDLVKKHGGTTSLETIVGMHFTELQSKSFLLDSTEDGGICMKPDYNDISHPQTFKYYPRKDIRLEIAEGSVCGGTIAGKYFTKFQLQPFLHSDSTEDDGIYMIPDYSNLASFVAGKEYLHYMSDTRAADYVPESIGHISCNYNLSLNLGSLLRYTNLRTLLLVCSPASRPAIFLDHANLRELLTKIPELKTLSLSGLPIRTLPDSIANLTKLKFLDVSRTLIEKLPGSVTSSCNSLFTLKLNDCVYLTELPSMENKVNLRHLDISGSNNIRAMPRGTGRLTNLHSLSNFIVRYVEGSHIKELKKLVNLSGKLSISGLQNIIDSHEAMEADLESKEFLRELVLEWTSKFSEQRNENVETEVLEYLKACSKLEALHIICYGGTRFPQWISVSNKLVSVTLSNCRNCEILPLLGQLPLLKVLCIEGMDQVKRIGTEFCGDDATFRSLESLEFKNMPCWEEWSFSSAESKALPSLQLLRLERCPKIKELEVDIESLEQLTINECQQLTSFSLGNLPKLLELDIQRCPNLKKIPDSFRALTKLRIWGCQNLTSLTEIRPAGKEFPRLRELDIENCTRLIDIPDIFPYLKKLRLTECRELAVNFSRCPKLGDLVISQVPNFVYSPAKLLLQIPELKNLEISKCVNLEASTEINGHEKQSSSSLKRLVIDGCPKLNQLEHDIFACFTSLNELVVVGCEALECFPDTALPAALKRLVIGKCKNLKSLPPNFFKNNLEFLEVYACPSLVSLSEDNLNNLRSLSVSECTSLKSLPAGLNRRNDSLTSLRITDCHSVQDFPLEGLPCNIRSLTIINYGNFKPLPAWGLHELECLRSFSLGGCPELESLDGVELPNSVAFLLLRGLSKLKSLTGLLLGLDSLDILTIRDCPKLETMTRQQQRLPASLSCLYVSNCPMLTHRCRYEEGNDWSKIEKIPLIEFDFQQYVRKEEQI